MQVFSLIFRTILDALFPISPAEEELLSYEPGQAFDELPKGRPSPVADAVGIFSYKDERVRRLIWCVKKKRSVRAARIAGYALAKIVAGIPGTLIIVPLPITLRRRRERGFNQCELLIKEMREFLAEVEFEETQVAAGTGSKRVEPKTVIFSNTLLKRVHNSSDQKMKDRADRLESAHGLFEVSVKVAEKLRGKIQKDLRLSSEPQLVNNFGDVTCIVIDDVITTGSTIKEAMKTLRLAGFSKVRGVAVAH